MRILHILEINVKFGKTHLDFCRAIQRRIYAHGKQITTVDCSKKM